MILNLPVKAFVYFYLPSEIILMYLNNRTGNEKKLSVLTCAHDPWMLLLTSSELELLLLPARQGSSLLSLHPQTFLKHRPAVYRFVLTLVLSCV